MKFERRHQMIKNFSRNTNYLNICKTICDKYSAKVKIENCAAFYDKIHPILRTKDLKLNIDKVGNITSVDFYGIHIKNSCNTFIMSGNNQDLFNVKNIHEEGENITLEGKKLLNVEFHNELMSFKYSGVTDESYLIPITQIQPYVGHRYTFEEENFIYFNRICMN